MAATQSNAMDEIGGMERLMGGIFRIIGCGRTPAREA